MKKPTDTPNFLSRLRSAARSLGRTLDRGELGSYENARMAAELTTIVERRSTFDR